MDAVFDAQLRLIADHFGNRGVPIGVVHKPSGAIDYVHRAGRLLARADAMPQIGRLLPGIQVISEVGGGADQGGLLLLSLDSLESGTGEHTVAEAMEVLDTGLGVGDRLHRADARHAGPSTAGREAPPVSPDHLMHITRLCPAGEPQVPGGDPAPWPAPRPAGAKDGAGGAGVRIAVVDTGLLGPDDRGPAPWLDGVTGEPDDLVRTSPAGVRRIERYAGHGTFAAGVARCMAPDAEVSVTDHFSASGAELESEMITKMEALFTGPGPAPDIINLSAGTYTRNDWAHLGFDTFARRHPDVLLVAAAGNDATHRPLYPAAFPWAISVGALGPDQQHRAWFSNYGPSVDVYALGEGLVNAFARGQYTYREPPRRPAVQHFDGMARWDGTSFAAPLVAGLIAVEAARTGVPAREAVRTLLAGAPTVAGLGPVLTV